MLDQKGYSLIEVTVSLALATVVLGAVYGFLASGTKTPRVQAERADLQAQVRSALEQMSRDVMIAGTNLPPEFPAFTPDGGGAVMEIVGSDLGVGEPVRVTSLLDGVALLEGPAPGIDEGDLVAIYDGAAKNGTWVLGLVLSIQNGDAPQMSIATAPGSRVGEVTLPSTVDRYNRSVPTRGFMVPVSVVTYSMTQDDGPALARAVNWGEPSRVASLEDVEIRYVVGGTTTVSDPILTPGKGKERLNKTPPVFTDLPGSDIGRGDASPGPARDYAQGTYERASPPVPQPNPSVPLQSSGVVQSVTISLTGRSNGTYLEGSTTREGDPTPRLRFTLASRVTPRNLVFGFEARAAQSDGSETGNNDRHDNQRGDNERDDNRGDDNQGDDNRRSNNRRDGSN